LSFLWYSFLDDNNANWLVPGGADEYGYAVFMKVWTYFKGKLDFLGIRAILISIHDSFRFQVVDGWNVIETIMDKGFRAGKDSGFQVSQIEKYFLHSVHLLYWLSLVFFSSCYVGSDSRFDSFTSSFLFTSNEIYREFCEITASLRSRNELDRKISRLRSLTPGCYMPDTRCYTPSFELPQKRNSRNGSCRDTNDIQGKWKKISSLFRVSIFYLLRTPSHPTMLSFASISFSPLPCSISLTISISP